MVEFDHFVYPTETPATNIGKKLSEMKDLFPKLRFLEDTPNSNNYQDSYTENGVSAFFTIKFLGIATESRY